MKILVITPLIGQEHKDMIAAVAARYGEEVCFASSEENIPEGFAKPDIIYGFGMDTARVDENLKWLCVPSAGVDYLMKPGIFANENCLISNSSGAYGVTIAEHIITVTLMMMRRITTYYSESLNGRWDMCRLQQDSIKDCRITLLGTGDIGCEFARRAKAFEPAKIVGISRSGKCSDPSIDQMFPIDRLDEVLSGTDLLVMSLPATPETDDILDRSRIALLPRGAYVVNVGRGNAVDEDALADALDAGLLAGAALDVCKTEPLPEDSRLWKTKNLLITPHVAGNLTLKHTLDKNVDMFCEDLENYLAGRPLRYSIDRNKGY